MVLGGYDFAKAEDTPNKELSTEESPNDFDKNHQVKVDTHLVI